MTGDEDVTGAGRASGVAGFFLGVARFFLSLSLRDDPDAGWSRAVLI